MTVPVAEPKKLTIPLPLAPHTNLHIQITHEGSSTLAFITSTEASYNGSLSSLGSFVYAMPNVRAFSSSSSSSSSSSHRRFRTLPIALHLRPAVSICSILIRSIKSSD